MKRVLFFLGMLTLMLSLVACSHETVTTSVTAPSTEPIQTMTTTAPAKPEPTEPAEPVSEVRTDGLIYAPAICTTLAEPSSLFLLLDLPEDCYPNMEITFDLRVNTGELTWESQRGTKISVINSRCFQWRILSDDLKNLDQIEVILVEAIIRADGHIIGYGIFEIGTNNMDTFALMRTETVIFPMIDGNLQDISPEHVAEQLAQLCQIITPFDEEAKWEEYRNHIP